jgi:hypothetical protein
MTFTGKTNLTVYLEVKSKQEAQELLKAYIQYHDNKKVAKNNINYMCGYVSLEKGKQLRE